MIILVTSGDIICTCNLNLFTDKDLKYTNHSKYFRELNIFKVSFAKFYYYLYLKRM